MFIHKKHAHDLVGGTETPESVALNRRTWLRRAGLGSGAALVGGGYWGWRTWRGSDDEVIATNADVTAENPDSLAKFFPVPRDARFQYDRAETARAEAARYTNFYEFSSYKSNWRYVDAFRPLPWQVEISGLCQNPLTLDLDDLLRRFKTDLTERQYRHRCVERWAMAVPWTGIPLAKILDAVQPLTNATHVRFISFNRPNEAPQHRDSEYPWPYTEGLTLPEAMNELTLVATGMYGRPLLKQHGAPLRLVVPWKYGFKSIKSITRIELVDCQPPTFWSTLNPEAYPFESNVEPTVPRPWPQETERMLGTNETFATRLYNGYEEFVGKLYS